MIAAYARHQSSLRAAAADSSAEEDSFSDLLLLMELLTNMLTKDIIDLGGHDGTTPRPAAQRRATLSVNEGRRHSGAPRVPAMIAPGGPEPCAITYGVTGGSVPG